MVFWRWFRGSPAKDPTSIGNLLLESGHCSDKQLRQALVVQKNEQDVFLGTLLIQEGIIDVPILRIMLEKQIFLRHLRDSDARNLAKVATHRTEAVTLVMLQFLEEASVKIVK